MSFPIGEGLGWGDKVDAAIIDVHRKRTNKNEAFINKMKMKIIKTKKRLS